MNINGIITQGEARHFPMKWLRSNFCSAPSETGVFWSLHTEEGLSRCDHRGAVEVLGARHGIHLREKCCPWDQKTEI